MATGGERRRKGVGSALVALAAVAMITWPMPPATASTPLAGPQPDHDCIDVNDTIASNGRVAGCVDAATVSPRFQSLLGTSGLGWVDIGSATPPEPTACAAGQVSREDGWVWRCVVTDGQHVLVRVKPWTRAAQLNVRHTGSPSRSTVAASANQSLTGCRLTASDKRLLRGQQATLSGRSARRTLTTSGLPAGRYAVRLACRDWRLNASSDLQVRPDGSAVLRSDCVDAWHDGKYADIVPGYGRRLDAAEAARAATACRSLSPLTVDEYRRAGKEAFLRIGQIAEREVRRVSAANGIPICEAIAAVFKPVDTVGRAVVPRSHPALGMPVPVAGYLPGGYFPVLHDQWTDGPVRMDSIADCGSGNQALRLASANVNCNAQGLIYGSDDPHQMYPVYVFESKCPQAEAMQERNRSSVCIVWGDRIGNNTIGGVGKVFAADAVNASGGAGFGTNHTFDCQDRALGTGQFANVDVQFMPSLT